jgi:psiF repeat
MQQASEGLVTRSGRTKSDNSLGRALKMRSLVSATLLSLAIGAGTALAQTPAPAPTGQQPTSAPQMSQDQKKTISKSCSDQATAKGLHGKERKKFRSECKKAGGKAH